MKIENNIMDTQYYNNSKNIMIVGIFDSCEWGPEDKVIIVQVSFWERSSSMNLFVHQSLTVKITVIKLSLCNKNISILNLIVFDAFIAFPLLSHRGNLSYSSVYQ